MRYSGTINGAEFYATQGFNAGMSFRSLRDAAPCMLLRSLDIAEHCLELIDEPCAGGKICRFSADNVFVQNDEIMIIAECIGDVPFRNNMFTAPELAQGRCSDERSAAVYSVGAVLFFALFGREPYRSEIYYGHDFGLSDKHIPDENMSGELEYILSHTMAVSGACRASPTEISEHIRRIKDNIMLNAH